MDIKVPKMNCNGCISKISVSLLTKGIEADFDLENKLVKINDDIDFDTAKAAINAAGYEIEA